MKHILSAAIIVIASIAFTSCHKVKGEGPTVSRTYSVDDFTSIEADIDADVFYTQDNDRKVEVVAQENIHSIIRMPVTGGKLRLHFEKFKNVRHYDRVTIYVSSPNINGLTVNGSGSLKAMQPISSGSLDLRISGSGNMYLSSYTGTTLSANISGSGNIDVAGGATTNEFLRISGSGSINTMNMSTRFAETETSGSGSTSLRVTDELDVRISGSGDVYYLGNPKLTLSVSGSGTVQHM